MRLTIGLLIFFAGLCAAISVAYGGVLPEKFYSGASSTLFDLDQDFQVRVEQRIMIRIPAQRSNPAAINMGNARSEPVSYKEKKIGKCLVMSKLVGSRPGPHESLDLVTTDGVLIRAYLGDGCLAREFYAGAYMERPDDGKLCIERDLLHARTGAKCEIDKFRLLVVK